LWTREGLHGARTSQWTSSRNSHASHAFCDRFGSTSASRVTLTLVRVIYLDPRSGVARVRRRWQKPRTRRMEYYPAVSSGISCLSILSRSICAKPVARVVILPLERVVEYARNGDHEEMRTEPPLRAAGRRQPDLRIPLGCITQSRRKVRRPPAYRSSPGRE
jgi:hypothetical protein